MAIPEEKKNSFETPNRSQNDRLIEMYSRIGPTERKKEKKGKNA